MLSVICILCGALALWLAATLFLWHRELLEIQKALEDIGAGNLNRRIVTRGPQAIRSIGYGINKIVQQSQQNAIQQKRHEQAYKQLITNLSHDIKTPLASLTGYLEAVENGLVVGQEKEEYLQTAYERAGALRSFVEKLFVWVKLDAGEQKLQIEPLDLCEISRQYVAEWIGPLESSGFSYTIEIPEEAWLAELDKNAELMANVSQLYEELISYADLYDSASFESKKMIVSQLVRRIDVYRGYQIHVDFNFDLAQYLENSDELAC